MDADTAFFDWHKETDTPGWDARDSMGKLVFREHLWLFGGWFNSGSECPRDVWKSADGIVWTCVQRRAPWKHSDIPACTVFKDRMWVMGGWYNGRLPDHEAGKEVWSSQDGVEWRLVTSAPGWSPRVGAAVVEFNGRMWLLGGVEHYFAGDEKSLRNDVWSTEDGEHWECAVTEAPWKPRAFHQALVFDGKLWLMGGGNYLPGYRAHNDVWFTEDGTHWQQACDNAPWHPRLWFSALVYREYLWVLGGWSNDPFVDWNDVWFSKNGKDWKQLQSDIVWAKRHEHAAYVFRDKLWVAGGHARPLSSEVWSIHLPVADFG